MHTCNTSTWKWKQEDQRFEVILNYMVNTRLAWDASDLVSKFKNKTKQNKYLIEQIENDRQGIKRQL